MTEFLPFMALQNIYCECDKLKNYYTCALTNMISCSCKHLFGAGITLSHQGRSELFICVECNSMPGFLPPNIHRNAWQLLPGKVQHSDSFLCFPQLLWGWNLHAQVTLHCLWKFKVPFGSPSSWKLLEVLPLTHWGNSPSVYRLISENLLLVCLFVFSVL